MCSTRVRTLLVAALFFTVAACKALDEIERPTGQAGRPGVLPKQPAVEPAVQDPLDSILRFEAARSDGEGFLQFQLARGDESVRTRAATALGRMPFPEQGASVSKALAAALGDESARVRAAAAFALGMRADPGTAGALVERLAGTEKDAEVRARLVEAASRIDEPRAHAAVLAALADANPRVRAEAALGPMRWKSDAADAAAVDAALVRCAGELRWPTVFALARRKSLAARALFVEALSDREPRVRIAAAQGLAALPADAASDAKLAATLADHDWRVVCEALVALGRHPQAALPDAFAHLVNHPSAHVRRCLFEALGNCKEAREPAVALLEKARVDPSANVRAAAIAAGAKLLGDAAAPDLELRRIDKDPLIRAGAAAAAAELSDALAVPVLLALSRDADLRVAGIAIEGLGKHLVEPSRARLLELVEQGDNGLALAAIEALRNQPLEADLPAMEACWRRAKGDIADELKAGLLASAAKIPGERAKAFVATNRAEPRRRTQVGALEHFESNPRVEIVTTRGKMVFELFPAEAPLHVHNFLELARRGYYTDLPFHRVVPDFVIQGGDYRGDGNGGKTWDGDVLPSEFTPRKYTKGSLGMPRNEDPDSGGSQFFVTHRETPHLDGRYTLFGQLLEGGDVLDEIEVGDLIRSVRLLEPRPGR